MRKRISCKVIRTIPLSNSSSEPRHKSRLNDKSYNINNATGTTNTNLYGWETFVNSQVKRSRKSVIYTDRLNILRIPIDDSLTAPILNCYA